MMSDSNTNSEPADTPLFDQASHEDWQKLAEKSLRGASLATLAHVTANGLAIEPLYSDRPSAQTLLPTQPLQRWDNRLAVLGDNPAEQNTTLLAGLQGGISSAQLQISSPEKRTPLSSEHLNQVTQNVQLDILPISLMAGTRFVEAATQLEAIWSAQQVSSDKAEANFNADPIGTLASFGSLSVELDVLLHEMSTLALRTYQSFPKVKAVCVNGSGYHNAGASIEQELVACISTASIYMQTMLDAGLSEQAAHNAIVFQLACDADSLSNVVKLRSLKALWYHVALHFNVPAPALQLVVETSLRMQSRLEPWVNHLRNVSAASAAAMGGAQTIIVHPHNRVDGVYVDNDIDASTRVARNIPIILSEESSMTFVHDPMGGSYAIETLTANLTDAAWGSLQKLETDGGLIKALSTGQWQAQIAATQVSRVMRLQEEKDVQVGVNRYTNTATGVSREAAMNNKPVDSQPLDALALQPARDASAFETSS